MNGVADCALFVLHCFIICVFVFWRTRYWRVPACSPRLCGFSSALKRLFWTIPREDMALNVLFQVLNTSTCTLRSAVYLRGQRRSAPPPRGGHRVWSAGGACRARSGWKRAVACTARCRHCRLATHQLVEPGMPHSEGACPLALARHLVPMQCSTL